MSLTLEEMKTNRKLWVEALRSGKYRQTKDMLQDVDGGMCCLGVLSDVAGCAWHRVEDRYCVVGAGTSDAAGLMAMEFVGLADDNGAYGDDGFSLAGQNDGGKSFEDIADIIEAEPPGLFVT